MHLCPQNNFWHLLTWAQCLHPPSPPPLLCSPTTSLSLSLGPRSLWHRWANPADVISGLFFLLLLFFQPSCLFAFARLAGCRMDFGCGVNEVICICPKLFAVDCLEGRTTGAEQKTSLSCLKTRREISILICFSLLQLKAAGVFLKQVQEHGHSAGQRPKQQRQRPSAASRRPIK